MLAVSGEQINRTDLNQWVQRCGVNAEWRKVCL